MKNNKIRDLVLHYSNAFGINDGHKINTRDTKNHLTNIAFSKGR